MVELTEHVYVRRCSKKLQLFNSIAARVSPSLLADLRSSTPLAERLILALTDLLLRFHQGSMDLVRPPRLFRTDLNRVRVIFSENVELPGMRDADQTPFDDALAAPSLAKCVS